MTHRSLLALPAPPEKRRTAHQTEVGVPFVRIALSALLLPPACKPGSVGSFAVDCSGPGRSFLSECGHPHPPAAYPQRLGRGGRPLAAYSALLRLGFTLPPPLPEARWALTPPFHPYLSPAEPGHRRCVFCGTVRHGAVSSAAPRRYLATCPRSPDFPRTRPEGHVRDRPAGGTGGNLTARRRTLNADTACSALDALWQCQRSTLCALRPALAFC